MKTVADIRLDKLNEEGKKVAADNKTIRVLQERIAWNRKQIESEKISVKDCIDQNFMGMAMNKIKAIQMHQTKISDYLLQISNIG